MKKEIRFWIWMIFVMFLGGVLNYRAKEGYVLCCCYILLITIAKEQWLKED